MFIGINLKVKNSGKYIKSYRSTYMDGEGGQIAKGKVQISTYMYIHIYPRPKFASFEKMSTNALMVKKKSIT